MSQPETSVPAVLSVSELRSSLATVLDGVKKGDRVFVGSHRRCEAVVLSVEDYERLAHAERRRYAMAEALASARAEGLEPSPEDRRLLDAVAAGEMSPDEAREQILAPFRR